MTHYVTLCPDFNTNFVMMGKRYLMISLTSNEESNSPEEKDLCF